MAFRSKGNPAGRLQAIKGQELTAKTAGYLSEREQKSVYRSLVKTARERIRRLEKSETFKEMTPAEASATVKTFPSLKPASKMNPGELKTEIGKVARFLREGRSASKLKKQKKKKVEAVAKSVGIAEEDVTKFWDFLDAIADHAEILNLKAYTPEYVDLYHALENANIDVGAAAKESPEEIAMAAEKWTKQRRTVQKEIINEGFSETLEEGLKEFKLI